MAGPQTRYTILLLYPDQLRGKGANIYVAYITASHTQRAIEDAQKEALHAQSVDDRRGLTLRDWKCVASAPGHIEFNYIG